MTGPSRRPLRPVQSANPTPHHSSGPHGPVASSGTSSLLTRRPTCSQCRIRKVRCDGKQHVCGNCQRLRFECSFQQSTASTRSEYVLKVPEARRRMQACLPCHERKTRCLGELPSCTNCVRRGRDCVYPKTTKNFLSSSSKDDESPTVSDGAKAATTREHDHVSTMMDLDGSAFPPPDLSISLVEDYFHHLYPLPSFSFLHRPTVIQRCRDGTIDEQLKLAICAITALQLQRSEVCHESWVQQAEKTILQRIGQPSIFQLQSLFLIVRYRIESGKFPTAFMLAGLAARTAVALRLNYERPDLSAVAQEARRRLYWSLYLLDDYFCVGLREFELCPEETTHLQLPCNEEVFDAGDESSTGLLHPDPSDAGVAVGLYGSYVRVTSARRANMRFIRRLNLGEESPATLRSSIQSLEQNLRLVHVGMGELGEYSATALTSSKWQAEYLMLHISWHQCHCDLYRSFIDSYSEAAPVAVLEGLHPGDRAALRQKCFEHAEAIIGILSDFAAHGDGGCQLERDVAVCAFEAARIVMFECRLTGLAAKMEEAIDKANLCLGLITRHFSFSASTKPLWKELKRLIENYAGHKAVQAREVPAVAAKTTTTTTTTTAEAAESGGPTSPRSTRLSQIATARQKLSVQSLLLQSDFVDDSEEIAYPEAAPGGPVAEERTPSRLTTTTTKKKKKKKKINAARSDAVTCHDSAKFPAAISSSGPVMGTITAQQGPPISEAAAASAAAVENYNTATVSPLHGPHASPGMWSNAAGTNGAEARDPSSSTTAGDATTNNTTATTATTLPMTTLVDPCAPLLAPPPAVPGFDPGFVFNPWMGFSGNEDLRAYYGGSFAIGLDGEY